MMMKMQVMMTMVEKERYWVILERKEDDDNDGDDENNSTIIIGYKIFISICCHTFWSSFPYNNIFLKIHNKAFSDNIVTSNIFVKRLFSHHLRSCMYFCVALLSYDKYHFLLICTGSHLNFLSNNRFFREGTFLRENDSP